MKPQKLLVATHNLGKLAELRSLLAELPLELIGLSDFDTVTEVEETGLTFIDNAKLKAAGYAQQTGSFALADDSGLEVDALNGRPGVLSARYGGDVGFDKKMQILLGEMKTSIHESRAARFVCAIAIAAPDGTMLHTTEGICPGNIAHEPRGNGGFGYDPLFVPEGFAETFGELSGTMKQKISHRARAFEQIMPFLRDFIAV
ncbi:MAG TPA: RdgB/HAM1 family non-canonical purine NTP pyrophosphatase [Pyrinomonadaceae bacterium]|nr:RdgB/HAM1 family non-canonical purine NTP pyrophosphatase [Pyrinomonadaceae bacterium]